MLSARTRFQQHITGEAEFRVDHFLFIFVAALGAAVLLVLKSGIILIPRIDLLGIALPVIVMIMYGSAVTVIPRIRLRLDQAGDNLYYLGFTYTLCSLAITLYRFHATEAAVDYIVSNFGIALATTIVGVVARVWLHQMREDPLELEREARSEITDAVSRLRAEIDQAVREFNHFNRTLQQSAQEAIETQGQVALAALDKSTKQYSEVTIRALGYLENSFADFQTQASELNQNSAKIATALAAFSQRIDDVEAPRDLLLAKLAPIFQWIAEAEEGTIGQLNQNNARIATALAAFSQRIDEVEAPKDLLSAKLAPIFQRLAEAAEQTVGRASSERQRNQNVAKLTASLETLATNMDGILNKVADKEERVTTAIQQAVLLAGQTAELSQQIRQWTERFTDIEERQAEIVGVLSRASEGAQDRDRQREESLRVVVTDATGAIAEYETRIRSLLQTHSELFETELQRAEKSFRALAATLSEGASLLADELGRRS
jgi:chromosome segregation ATPase